MATFTVLNRHGDVQERSASLVEAAHIVLGYDGHEYDIRPMADGAGFELWTSAFSRNAAAYNGLRRSVIFSIEIDRAAAEQEIYQRVVSHPEWFENCQVMTDADYDAMLRVLREEEQP